LRVTVTGRGIDGMGAGDAEALQRARQIRRFVIYSSLVSPATKGMTPMDQSQVAALEEKHAHLEALIDEEEHRPHPDDIRLHELKKEKLRVKDEMVGH